MQFISDDDEIPMRERDELRNRNSFGKHDEIPMWNRDKEWRCNLLAMMMKFQGGIETNVGMQRELHSRRNSNGEETNIQHR